MKNPWYFPGSYWFPVAALYAAIALPWSVLGQLGLLPAPQALQTGLDHAHEMIFGYALAVVAGYTLVPGSGKKSFVLLGVWLAARPAFLLAPLGSLAFALDALFVLGLAGLVAPIYLRASKWSNRSVGLIVGALAAAAGRIEPDREHCGSSRRNWRGRHGIARLCWRSCGARRDGIDISGGADIAST